MGWPQLIPYNGWMWAQSQHQLRNSIEITCTRKSVLDKLTLRFNGIISTHWGRDKMDAISQTAFSSAFYWMKMYELRLKNSLKFVPKGPISNIPALVQIMAWRRPGDKPLSEPMLVSLPTHICVTRSQWFNRALSFLSECCGMLGVNYHVFYQNHLGTSLKTSRSRHPSAGQSDRHGATERTNDKKWWATHLPHPSCVVCMPYVQWSSRRDKGGSHGADMVKTSNDPCDLDLWPFILKKVCDTSSPHVLYVYHIWSDSAK